MDDNSKDRFRRYYESPWVRIVSNYMGTPRGVGVPPTTGHWSQHWYGIGLVLGIGIGSIALYWY